MKLRDWEKWVHFNGYITCSLSANDICPIGNPSDNHTQEHNNRRGSRITKLSSVDSPLLPDLTIGGSNHSFRLINIHGNTGTQSIIGYVIVFYI